MFTNLNAQGEALEFIEANSAEELHKILKSITLPTRIITIYAIGTKHIAWIETNAKIIKKKIGEK